MTATHSPSGDTVNKGLKAGALGLGSAIVIGVASTAPGYSVASGLGLIAGEAGKFSPAVLWVAFLPMFFIAAAYKYFNKVDPDCGTTFTWVTRAFGPKTGWMAGWGVIMADLIIMPNLAAISGKYLFLLFGASDLAENIWANMFVGILFILAMTWICVIGIELNAETQMALLGAEVIVLVIFAVVALSKGVVSPELSWLNPLNIKDEAGSFDWTHFAAAINVSLFIYWGWDTAVAVNEECADADKTPGRAAIISTLILVATYVIVGFAAIGVRGADFLSNHSDDVLDAAGKEVFGDGIMLKFLVVAVLTSAAASCQTTILPAARSALSMGVHKALPPKFAETHPRYLTPTFSTWLFGGISIAWYVLLVLVSETTGSNVLEISVAGVGLAIAFYYGMTGIAAVWYFRKYITTNVATFFKVGVSCFLGAAMLLASFVITIKDDVYPGDGSCAKTSVALEEASAPVLREGLDDDAITAANETRALGDLELATDEQKAEAETASKELFVDDATEEQIAAYDEAFSSDADCVGTIGGIGLLSIIGLGLLLLGLPIMLWCKRTIKGRFFDIMPDPADEIPSPYEGPAPTLGSHLKGK